MNPLDRLGSLDPTKKAVTLLDEFKAFAFKGNVIDLAVGVIIGAAFAKIVDSLVKHLMMPLMGTLVPTGGGYEQWKWVINGKEVPYGLFLAEVVNFLLVAAVLFVFIRKFLGWMLRAQQEGEVLPPLTTDQELLTEIRDLLRAKGNPTV